MTKQIKLKKENYYCYCAAYKYGRVYSSGTWKTNLNGINAYRELSTFLYSKLDEHVITFFNKL